MKQSLIHVPMIATFDIGIYQLTICWELKSCEFIHETVAHSRPYDRDIEFILETKKSSGVLSFF